MATPTKLKKIHEDALLEFDKIQESVREERLLCLEDRRFYSIAGAQWEGALGDQFINKPKFEVNKVHLALIRIFNEYRNNRVSIIFTEGADADNADFAEIATNIHRSDEQDSSAEEAYDNAFEEAIGGGFGAWRLRAEYEDEEDDDNDHQRILIEPIYDADSTVFFDRNSKKQDKSDAKSCFVLTPMSLDSYKEEYEDDPTSWGKDISKSEFDWFVDDTVWLAELYKVETVKEVIHIFTGLTEDERRISDKELKDDLALQEELAATGYKETRSKIIKRKKVHKYILSGGKVLEDCGYVAGKHIPIVPCYGKRWMIDNIERCMGHVRLCKDIQRLKNMQLSKLGELSAMSSVEKPIFTDEMISGHETEWANDLVENYTYLRVNALKDANGNPMQVGPIGYTKAPTIPPAMAALLQITEQDIQDLLGNQQQGEQLQPNVSGLAIELIQNKLDMQSYIYISNHGKAKKRSAQIWLSMSKDLLVEDNRKIKSVDDQEKSDIITLNTPTIDAKTGVLTTGNDFSKANFDVTINIGPSSESKKQAAVRTLMNMMQVTQDPETVSVLGSMAIMNMEGEGIKDVRDFFRQKLIRMGVIKPNAEEAAQIQKEQAAQPPDPQAEYVKAAARQADADAQLKEADRLLTIEKAKKTSAETAKIENDSHLDGKKHNLEVAKTAHTVLSSQSSQNQTTTTTSGKKGE